MDSLNESINKTKRLIFFDKSGKIEYFGEFDLQVNNVNRCLDIKFGSVEITSTYNRNYFQRGNFLCASGGSMKNVFVVVLRNNELCENVLCSIKNAKISSNVPLLPDLSADEEEELFKNKFLLPIIEEIKSQSVNYMDLKAILFDFVTSIDDHLKRAYSRILESKDLRLPLPSSNQADNSIQNSLMINKRSAKNRVGRKQTFETRNFELLKDDYQLVKRKHAGKFVERLIIFTKFDKSLCYEFGWKNTSKTFECIKCRIHKYSLTAKLERNNTEEYVEVETNNHKCQPIQFQPENLSVKIIQNPVFKFEFIMNKQKRKNKILIFRDLNGIVYNFVYRASTKNFVCRSCERKRKFVQAKLCENENGENYIELSDADHICDPKDIEFSF